MTQFLSNKHILLGLTGSIAVYKSAELVRRLREVGAVVRVVMTNHAKEFITPLTMQALSGYPVHDELFDVQAEAAMGHIELARWADLVVIAPATADCMAKLASGKGEDLLTTLCLATTAPLAIAPAMNQGMWKHTSTQTNLQVLQQKNIHILGPAEGSQACGDIGPGRMLEPIELLEKINNIFARDILAGIRIIITAGPTHEAIDPVRFIANGSSGKMGYALAEAAREAGANVTLISGPVSLLKPRHIDPIEVTTAQEMHDAVMRNIGNCDIFLGVAAVADYRCQTIAPEKIHKQAEEMTLTLVRNPDIVLSVAQLPTKPFIVGFAAETTDVLTQARQKRQRKKMDMIIANQVGNGMGIGNNDNAVTVITEQTETTFSTMSKTQLARQLITLIAKEYRKKEHDRKINAA